MHGKAGAIVRRRLHAAPARLRGISPRPRRTVGGRPAIWSCSHDRIGQSSAGRCPEFWPPSRGEAMTATKYRSVDVDGLKVFYREAGPADAPALLLLHGFPTASYLFR